MNLLRLACMVGLSVAGLALLFPSYVSTAIGLASESVKNQVPIEFEIERARGLIRGIEPQIDTCKRDVAAAEVAADELTVEVEKLREHVAARTERLKTGKELLAAPAVALVAAVPAGAIAGANGVPRERVVVNVKRELEALKNERQRLEIKQRLLERQRASVTVRQERLFAVRTEKERLEDVVENLLMQQQHVQALAAQSPDLKLDDSALGEAKRLLAEIKKRLDVSQKVLENDMVFDVGPSEPPIAADQVVAEVDAFLASVSPGTR